MAGNGMNVTVDVAGMKEFDKVMLDYMQWSKRQPSEIINAKMYFVALNALQVTKAVNPNHIRMEMHQQSIKHPEMTLGEVLTLKDLMNRGKMPKKGKTLKTNMSKYVTRFIKKRQNSVNFLRAGWLPAIKKLDYWNRKGDITFVKRFSPKLNRAVKQYGKEKGDVVPAKQVERCTGILMNFIGQGKHATQRVSQILLDGAKQALQMEISSMKKYIERKFNEHNAKVQKQNTFI